MSMSEQYDELKGDVDEILKKQLSQMDEEIKIRLVYFFDGILASDRISNKDVLLRNV